MIAVKRMFNMSWIHVAWPHGSLAPYGTRPNGTRIIMEQDYTRYKVYKCGRCTKCTTHKVYKMWRHSSLVPYGTRLYWTGTRLYRTRLYKVQGVQFAR